MHFDRFNRAIRFSLKGIMQMLSAAPSLTFFPGHPAGIHSNLTFLRGKFDSWAICYSSR